MQQFVLLVGTRSARFESNRIDSQVKHIQDSAGGRGGGWRAQELLRGDSKNILRAHFNCNKCPRAIDREALGEWGKMHCPLLVALRRRMGVRGSQRWIRIRTPRADGAERDRTGQTQKLTSCTKSKANDNRRQRPRQGRARLDWRSGRGAFSWQCTGNKY